MDNVFADVSVTPSASNPCFDCHIARPRDNEASLVGPSDLGSNFGYPVNP